VERGILHVQREVPVVQFISALVLFSTHTVLAAAPVPVVPADPLPKGATARLGSVYCRGPISAEMTFSQDGKRILLLDRTLVPGGEVHGLRLMDSDTGKAIPSRLVPPAGLERFTSVRPELLADRVVWFAESPGSKTRTPVVTVSDFEGKEQNRFEINSQPASHSEFARYGFGGDSVSPDGRFLATMCDSGQVLEVYELGSGKRLLEEKLGKGIFPTVRFGQDNTTLFLRQAGKPIRRFEFPSGKELAPLEGSNQEILVAAASPDSKWVVTSTPRAQKVVDGKTRYEDITFAEVWDGKTGKVVGRLEVGRTIHHFVFAGPESLAVSAYKPGPLGGLHRTVSYWSTATRKRLWEVPSTGFGVTAAPDGKRIACHGGSLMLLHDTATGAVVADPGGHFGSVGWIGFRDDKTVVTAGADEVMTWTIKGERKHRVTVPELQGQILSYAPLAMRGALSWSGSKGGLPPLNSVVVGWDHEKNALGWRLDLEKGCDRCASPDGTKVVCVRSAPKLTGETVTVYEGATGKLLHEWSYARPEEIDVSTWARTLTGEGRYVVAGGTDALLVFDALTGKEVGRVKPERPNPVPKFAQVPVLEVSANGARLALLERGKVTIQDVKTGKVVAQHDFKDPLMLDVKFSPDGKQLALWSSAAPQSSTVFVLAVDAPEQAVRKLVAEPWSTVACVAFAPNTAHLAVGYGDGTALIWDLAAK
jgi:WD40 repeat protein